MLPPHSVGTNFPLEITIRRPSGSDDFQPPNGWQSASDPGPKIVVLVQIKNVSDRKIVLPAFASWFPGITFTSHSFFARKPHLFLAPTGQINWISLNPGQSTTAFDDISNYVTFLASGTYRLDYNVGIGYCYAKELLVSEDEASLAKVYPRAEQTIDQSGTLDVRVDSDQVSSR